DDRARGVDVHLGFGRRLELAFEGEQLHELGVGLDVAAGKSSRRIRERASPFNDHVLAPALCPGLYSPTRGPLASRRRGCNALREADFNRAFARAPTRASTDR